MFLDLPYRIEAVQSLGLLAGVHTNGTGGAFDKIQPDYMLLSKPTGEKLRIADSVPFLQVSKVIRRNGQYENILTTIRGENENRH